MRRTCEPLRRYSFWPSRYTTRSTVTSLKSRSSRRDELSKTTFTLARLPRGSPGLPPQMRSSPFFERIDFIDCSPSTKRNPSATLDLPEPLGPTILAIGDVKISSVFLPNDLNPANSIDFRYIGLHCIKTFDPGPNGPGSSICERLLWSPIVNDEGAYHLIGSNRHGLRRTASKRPVRHKRITRAR